MAYEVPPLPYDYNALEPTIDEQTMHLHHDKHHQAYVDKANDAIAGTEWEGKPVEEVLQNLSSLPDDKQGPFRNNGGGHANHSLSWESMSPDGGGEPSGELADAINEAFGSFDAFRAQFTAAALGLQGSGWAFLAYEPIGGNLVIEQLYDQQGNVAVGTTPLLMLDMWEHAFYLDYVNVKADYVKAFWNIANWADVAKRFEAARANATGLIVL